jgi:hypothetical protein
MLCRGALVRTDVSEERIASIIRMTRIRELGTTIALPINRRTLSVTRSTSHVRWLIDNAVVVLSPYILVTLMMMEALCSSETSVFTRGTRHHIPEEGILQYYCVHMFIPTNNCELTQWGFIMRHLYSVLKSLYTPSQDFMQRRWRLYSLVHVNLYFFVSYFL